MRLVAVTGILVCLSRVVACAGVGEAVAGTCLALTLQVGAQICVDAVCGDDKPENPEPEEQPLAELPPPPPGEPGDDEEASGCRLKVDEGSALRLDCVDGSSAVVLGDPALARVYPQQHHGTVEGDVVVATVDDVAALAGVFAITGDLRISGASFLRLRLPSLRSVGGNLVIEKNPRLVRVELANIIDVGGDLFVGQNRALSADPMPRLAHVGRVDVIDNDALPLTVVDRLLALSRADR